jgi:hypothetical protein
MKYYVYISDSKVDMLLPQITDEKKKKIATEFKIDLKLLSASWKSEREPINDRIKRLEVVCNFIRCYADIGTADQPGQWIEGNLLMSWLVIPESNLIYLTTSRDSSCESIVGLGGSAKHIIGNSTPSNMSPASRSELSGLIKDLNDYFANITVDPVDKLESPSKRPLLLAKIAADLSGSIPKSAGGQFSSFYAPPVQNQVEFLARRLLYGTINDRQVLLATPLYIALAE